MKHSHFSATYFIARRLRQAPKKAFTRIVYQIGIVSVALGLSTTLIAFSAMEGFQQNITQKLTGFGGDLQVVKYSLHRTAEEPPWSQKKIEGIQDRFSTTIEAIKAFAHKTVLLQAADDLEGVVCKGIDHGTKHDNLQPYLTAGRLIDFSDPKYSHEVVLSTYTAARLQVQVGDEVTACVMQKQPRYRKLQVVGLYATHIEDLDKQLAFCDLRLVQRLNDWPPDWVGGYEIFLKDPKELPTVVGQLTSWIDYDLGLKTTQDEHAILFDWLHIMQTNAMLFTGLILLVMCSNLASIVLIQMMERTTMIGILKTIGASDRQIQQTMLWNNLHMVGQGILWGNCISAGVYMLQHHTQFITLHPAYYYLDHLPMVWNWRIVVGFNLLALGIVLTALFVSLALIVRRRPIQVLKP